MICFTGCVAVHTAGCRPVVPSSWEEGLGVVEKNNVRHICFICCDRVCSATTPAPLLPGGGDHAGCSSLFGQTRGSAPTVGCNAIRMANSKL